MKPALFIDRDGTINKDCPYCRNESEIKIFDDVFAPIAKLSKIYYIIIITNQSGISRGYFSLSDLEMMNEKIKREVAKRGGRVDAIYFCPHKEEDNCGCRKPKTGMIEKAAKDFDIDLPRSFVIGDDDKDMLLAKNIGLKGIRVRKKGNEKGDYFAEDFYKVAEIALKKHKK